VKFSVSNSHHHAAMADASSSAGGASKAAPSGASAQNVQVAVRIKPLSSSERHAWRALPEHHGHIQQFDEADKAVPKQLFAFGTCSRGWTNARAFSAPPSPQQCGGCPSIPANSADHVLGPSAGQKDVFNMVAKGIVRSVVNGYNGTIFAYGQTAAGKTFTMQGNGAHPGVLPQAIQEITNAIAEVRARDFDSYAASSSSSV